MPQLLLTFLLIGIGWFFIIRPQQVRLRAQRAMVAALAVGDHVITAGGIHGTLTEVGEETVRIEVAPGLELTLARAAVSRRVDDASEATDRTTTGTEGADHDHDDVDDIAPGLPGDHAEDDVNHHPDGPTTDGPA